METQPLHVPKLVSEKRPGTFGSNQGLGDLYMLHCTILDKPVLKRAVIYIVLRRAYSRIITISCKLHTSNEERSEGWSIERIIMI